MIKLLSDKKLWRLYLLTALLFLFFLSLSYYTNYPDTFISRTFNSAWRLLYLLPMNFILFEYTFSRANRKKIWRIGLLLGLHVILYSRGLYAWRQIGINLHTYKALVVFPSTGKAIEDQMTFSMMSIFFFGIVRHIYNHIRLRQSAQQLRIEKQEAELNYLKSQTNPHFLFNTLNNIYSLTREKSDRAPESVLRLSKILRFMLYEATGKYIAIEQEIKIISDYIELEKLRYDESLRINFNYDIEDMRQALPPLLLIPLVENAFKHGVSETRGSAFVDIHLSVKQRQLAFVVKNSAETEDARREVKENIGLSNLRRQLELLYKEYDLSVQPGNGIFTAVLKINLASHV